MLRISLREINKTVNTLTLKISNIKDCQISKPTHPESKTTIALNPSLDVRENYVLEYKQKFKN